MGQIHRTYRELYRGKVEIRSIGVGPGKLKIPRGVSLGVDTVILAALCTSSAGLVTAYAVNKFYPQFPSFIVSVGTGVLLAGWLSRFDPQGKSVLRWFFDYLSDSVRPGRHDGWQSFREPSPIRLDAYVYGVEDGESVSTPVVGDGDVVTLHRPLALKVHKKGRWTVSRNGVLLEAGRYQIKNGKAVPLQPPVIRLKKKTMKGG